MIKIESVISGTFNIQNGVQISTHIQSTSYYTMKDSDKISIYESGSNGTVTILPPVNYTILTDANDAGFASSEEAVEYIMNTIKPLGILSAPASKLISTYLLNAGSNDMTVDGSGVPVIFESVFSAPSILTKLSLFLQDGQAFANDDFAAINALTNGVLLMVDGQPAALWNTNGDIALDSDAYSTTFLAQEGRNILADKIFNPNLFLPQGASVQIIIRDNLIAVTAFNVKIEGTRL